MTLLNNLISSQEENDIPTATDNSPRPEDGLQPTEEELQELVEALLLGKGENNE